MTSTVAERMPVHHPRTDASPEVARRPRGRSRLRRREGELAVNQQLVLHPDDLVRGDQAVTVPEEVA